MGQPWFYVVLVQEPLLQCLIVPVSQCQMSGRKPTVHLGPDVCPWPISYGWGGHGHQVRSAVHTGEAVSADSEKGSEPESQND